jgi:hypothetical protein
MILHGCVAAIGPLPWEDLLPQLCRASVWRICAACPQLFAPVRACSRMLLTWFLRVRRGRLEANRLRVYEERVRLVYPIEIRVADQVALRAATRCPIGRIKLPALPRSCVVGKQTIADI